MMNFLHQIQGTYNSSVRLRCYTINTSASQLYDSSNSHRLQHAVCNKIAAATILRFKDHGVAKLRFIGNQYDHNEDNEHGYKPFTLKRTLTPKRFSRSCSAAFLSPRLDLSTCEHFLHACSPAFLSTTTSTKIMELCMKTNVSGRSSTGLPNHYILSRTSPPRCQDRLVSTSPTTVVADLRPHPSFGLA